MICPSCGSNIEDNALFCTKCGYKIEKQNNKLATKVLDELVSSTGCRKEYVWETDSMSGINWCEVPATIVEVGYMTNLDEDALLVTEDYQNKVIKGIADSIDKYFEDDQSILKIDFWRCVSNDLS